MLCFSVHAHAVTKTVCASGCDYTTIADAWAYDFEPADILELRADSTPGSKTYAETINPGSNDVGDSGDQFTIQGRAADTITIAGAGVATLLDLSGGEDYITVKNLTFGTFSSRWAYLNGNTGFIGEDLIFDNVPATGGAYGYFAINAATDHKYTNCSWNGDDQTENVQHDGVWWGEDASTRILFDTCTFLHFQHTCVSVRNNASYTVFRDCIFNNKWRSAVTTYGAYTLLEDTTFYGIGKEIATNPYILSRVKPNPAIYLHGADYSIIRRNKIYDSDIGIYFTGSEWNTDIKYNKIYNNTFYDINKHNTNYKWSGTFMLGPMLSYDFTNNSIVNNIFWMAEGATDGKEFWVWEDSGDISSNLVDNNIIADSGKTVNGVWDETTGDVADVDANADWGDNLGLTTNDPLMTAPDTQDFTLQALSPAIDAGAWLTTITTNDTSSPSDTFTVADGGYFYDGWDIDGETGDVIRTENGQTATITDVTGNVITLDAAITWTTDEGIALDYAGTKPDIGAEERGTSVFITGPSSSQDCADTSDPYTATQEVTATIESSTNATCKYDTASTDPCSTATYAGLASTFTDTTGQTTHTTAITSSCANGGVDYSVICIDDVTSLPSNCLIVTITVLDGGGVTPQSGMNIDVGGTVSITTGGTVSITTVLSRFRIVDSDGKYFVDSEGNYLTGAN